MWALLDCLGDIMESALRLLGFLVFAVVVLPACWALLAICLLAMLGVFG